MRLAIPPNRWTARAVSILLMGVLVLLAIPPSAQEAEEEPPPDPTAQQVALVVEAFEEGDCDALLDLGAARIEVVLLGQGARYSRGQASLILRDFFRRYPPDSVELSERSTTAEGRAAMGRYWSGNSSAPFALYVGFRVSDAEEEEEEEWTLEAIRIERASFQRTGTF